MGGFKYKGAEGLEMFLGKRDVNGSYINEIQIIIF